MNPADRLLQLTGTAVPAEGMSFLPSGIFERAAEVCVRRVKEGREAPGLILDFLGAIYEHEPYSVARAACQVATTKVARDDAQLAGQAFDIWARSIRDFCGRLKVLAGALQSVGQFAEVSGARNHIRGTAHSAFYELFEPARALIGEHPVKLAPKARALASDATLWQGHENDSRDLKALADHAEYPDVPGLMDTLAAAFEEGGPQPWGFHDCVADLRRGLKLRPACRERNPDLCDLLALTEGIILEEPHRPLLMKAWREQGREAVSERVRGVVESIADPSARGELLVTLLAPEEQVPVLFPVYRAPQSKALIA